MNKARRLLSFAVVLVFVAQALGGGKIGSKLGSALASLNENDQVIVWVFFTDKGTHEQLRSSVPLNVVSQRSIQRRLKVRVANEVVDYTDLPVEQSYVSALSQHVLKVRQQSKWFNAASVVATKAQIPGIESLPYVSSIELVYRARNDRRLEQEQPESDPPGGGQGGNQIYDLNYGTSLGQNQQINVPAVHNTGNYAQGVLVGVFDDGVSLLSHQAFDTLRTRIVAMYDFVDHDPNPAPIPGQGGSHGVSTLSIIGGYKEGQLIGPAFGASFIIARTEYSPNERPIEEDNWAAAIEWADSIGVDVTSTSLGYLDYDSPYPSWTWQDMNGNTTVITRAADMAVAKGIVVLNSAGNAGSNSTRNTLGAPADGDSVLAIGALTSGGTRASYSSVGPTTSNPPRFKPDIMAQGSSVWNASSSGPTAYGTNGSGTSYACPLAAGVAALVIKARPNATAIQVINALRATASNAGSPNNLIGWGTINAVAAINALTPTSVNVSNDLPTAFALEQNYPNPFNPSTNIRFSLTASGFTTLKVLDLLGREVATLVSGEMNAGNHQVAFDASTVPAGRQGLSSGTYFYKLQAGNNIAVKKLMLVK